MKGYLFPSGGHGSQTCTIVDGKVTPARLLERRPMRIVHQVFTRLEPTPWLMSYRLAVPEFTLIGIYRRRNAATMARLAEQAPRVLLWGLDGVHPALASATLGEGPGGRFDLLNRLAAEVESPYIVVADDDVRIMAQSLAVLVAITAHFFLDLCQPAHGLRSIHGHRITMRRPLSVLRETNFVDIGPILVIGPRFRERIVPFPPGLNMGWAVELDWMELCEHDGARLGIVDAVPIRHIGAIAGHYDATGEKARVKARLAQRGAARFDEVWRVYKTVRPWQFARAVTTRSR